MQSASLSDPSNVKTIAQFNLYADPSVTPIKVPHVAATTPKALMAGMRLERGERHRDLFSRGLALARSQPIISKLVSTAVEASMSLLEKAAAEHGITLGATLPFNIKEASISKSMPFGLIAKGLFPSRVYVIFSPDGTAGVKEEATAGPVQEKWPQVPHRVVLIVKEVDGKVVSAKKIFSR